MPFQHPSNIRLHDLKDTIIVQNAILSVMDIIEYISKYFDYTLLTDNIFCFNDYTYSYLIEKGYSLSKGACKLPRFLGHLKVEKKYQL